MASSFQVGRGGEAAAAAFLELQGCQIIATNFRAANAEIDLIVRDGQALAFVEVKTWAGLDSFDLAYSVGRAKRRKIIAAARSWLAQQATLEYASCRFDILFIRLRSADYQWYKAAFDASQ